MDYPKRTQTEPHTNMGNDPWVQREVAFLEWG